MIFRPTAAAATLLAVSLTSSYAQDSPTGDGPLKTGVVEEVRVRLVLIDALVLDRKNRIVSDLEPQDFELLLDHDRLPIDTLDLSCPAGPAPEPRSVSRPELRQHPGTAGIVPKIVLAFDYMHLRQTERAEVLENAIETIRHGHNDDAEVMIVAITGTLRIEQLFTTSQDRLVEVLERMKHDITLWQPPFDHEHELRFFNSLADLIDLLGLVSGSKAVVLFSNLPGPSATYDTKFEEVATRAARTRTALYPVFAAGLTPYRTAPRLARLAVETGGRFTERTNDLSLGYARARRDLACRYTVGFYDTRPDERRSHRLTLRVRRHGLRVVHPNSYRFAGEETKKESHVRSALYAPEFFDDASVIGGFFPLRPHSENRWFGLLAVSFPAALDRESSGDVGELTVSMRRGNTVRHESRRHLSVPPARPGSETTRLTVIEPVRLPSGHYEVGAVLSSPDRQRPRSTGFEVDLNAPPRDEVFLVGPYVGRTVARALRVLERTGGDAEPAPPDLPFDGFQPLLERDGPGPAGLKVLTHVCIVGARNLDSAAAISRSLRRQDEPWTREFPAQALRLEQRGGVRCQALLDDLPGKLAPGRYVFQASVISPGETVTAHVEFDVTAGLPEAAALYNRQH